MSKQVIAVDIDDVLASSAEEFVAYSNKLWGTHLSVDDYTEHWAELWGVDHKEAEKRAQHIYKSNIQGEFRRFDEAHEVLADLAKKYKLVIITSRHRLVQQTALQWLDRHFNGVFSAVHFAGIWDVGHAAEHALHLTKGELTKEIGADYLIDDQPKHCLAAAKLGVRSLLFGDYPWSRSIKKLPINVYRAHNWQEVQLFFRNETSRRRI